MKSKKKRKESLFFVVLDKMCVFYLYPIPDSQQRVKRGRCRRPILSGLLWLLSFWASGPFVARFEFGSRTLSFSFYLFCQVFESLCVSHIFHVNCRFMSNCYLCLNVFSSNHVVSYYSMSLVLIFVHVKCHFILINSVF